jgi:hypothetical protein
MRAFSALCLLVLASAGQAQQPGQVAPPEKARWEYAELFYRTTTLPAKDNEERPQSTVTVRWTTAKEEALFKGWGDFAEKLKADLKKEGTPNLHRIQILNHLGSEFLPRREAARVPPGYPKGWTGFRD